MLYPFLPIAKARSRETVPFSSLIVVSGGELMHAFDSVTVTTEVTRSRERDVPLRQRHPITRKGRPVGFVLPSQAPESTDDVRRGGLPAPDRADRRAAQGSRCDRAWASRRSSAVAPSSGSTPNIRASLFAAAPGKSTWAACMYRSVIEPCECPARAWSESISGRGGPSS